MKRIALTMVLSAIFSVVQAQTASSLFKNSDKVQISMITPADQVSYQTVGHHGPAVENSQMALRIYYNSSGAIDVYNKQKEGLELDAYHWYPTARQQAEGAGVDEYYVGKTSGLGGLAIFDGKDFLQPAASGGMTARVGKTRRGSYAEMIYHEVIVHGKSTTLTLRIDMYDNTRWARITARSDSPLILATGVNFPDSAFVEYRDGAISVWGIHPADVSKTPRAIGAAMHYRKGRFSNPEKMESAVMVHAKKPTRKISTKVISASSSQVGGPGSTPTMTDWRTYLDKASKKAGRSEAE